MSTEPLEEIDLGAAFDARPLAQPQPLGDELARITERLQRAARSPEHLAEVARREADLARVRRRALAATATALELPAHEDLRAVAYDDDPRETAALRAVRAALTWRNGRRVGQVLVLTGPPGTGKSSACAWVVLRAETGALWTAAPDVLATPRNGFSENTYRWERWQSVPLLVVDDLGTETGDAESLATLLAVRFDRGLLTLASTNLDARDFASRYLAGPAGARLSDRLRGQRDAGLRWIATTGTESLRGGPR